MNMSMAANKLSQKLRLALLKGLLLLLLLSLPAAFAQMAEAQSEGRIQEFEGHLDPSQILIYQVPALRAGDTVYVYMEGLTGNLDPFVGLVPPEMDFISAQASFQSEIAAANLAGRDPLEAIVNLRDQFFLAWDDDSGASYDAALAYEMPADGNLRLLIGGALGSIDWDTFGDYRLLVGVDAPEVLRGQGRSSGEVVAALETGLTPEREGVESRSGSFIADQLQTFFPLENIAAGNTLYVYVEGDAELRPSLVLRDFGDKPLRSSNTQGEEKTASFSYTFPEAASGYRLVLESCCGEEAAEGTYRLVTGINTPEVLEGGALGDRGSSVLQSPIDVAIGVQLEQITGVDQTAENFGAVATIQMEWTDPALAFSPEECECRFKSFAGSAFGGFLEEAENRWPDFTIVNQQGNRWTQNRVAVVSPAGNVIYLERFSTTLQAPDFDFHQFPLDNQDFFIRVAAIFPEEFYSFQNREDLTVVGDQLGEEEWYITDWSSTIESTEGATSRPTSLYSFDFNARRHLSFYIIRMFVPILIIIAVSWFTFFLQDYGKRVDIAAGNMLLFIAFNFTVSNDLPRLGYLTYLDTILMSTFIVTAFVVVFNVVLKRLEITGRTELARKLDTPMIWIYPLLYGIGFLIVTWIFFF